MARSIKLAPDYSGWTKSQLIERLVKLQHHNDELNSHELAPGSDEEAPGGKTTGSTLFEAIATMSEGFALFDAEDRLQLFNSRYVEEIWPQIADKLVPGVTFETIVRETIKRGVWEGSEVDLETLVKAAMERHRDLPSVHEIRYPNGRCIRQSKQLTASGGVVAVYADITEIKRRETALEESEWKLVNAQRIAHVGDWERDVRTDDIRCSEECVRILGLDPGTEPTYQMFLEVVHPEDRAAARRIALSAVEKGVPVDGTYRVIRHDGSIRVIYTKVEVVRDETDRVTRLYGTNQDITDRIRGQLADRRLAAIVESSIDAIVAITTEGIVTDWNPAAEQMYGYTAAEIIGEPISIIIPPDQQPNFQRNINALESGGQLKRFESVRRCKDGSLIDVSLSFSPLKNEAGAIVGVSAIHRDITERKRAENILRESQERFSAFFDNSPLAMILKDRDSRFRLVNRRFEEWYGISQVETFGKTSHEVFPNEFVDVFVEQDRETIDRSALTEREYEFRFSDGADHTIFVTKFPVLVGGDQPIGIGTIVTDVTEYRKIENSLRQAQKMEAVGQLTGGVAHDFNNLLAVILGNAELLGEQIADEDGLVQKIVRAALRGAELTHRLLAFSRRQPLQRNVTDVDALITSMLDLLRMTLGETIEIKMNSCADPWNIEIDPAQMESAILNAAINARNAMPKGGTLEIETANVVLDRSDVAGYGGCSPGDYVRLAMADTGVGMSAEVLEHAFEPFFTTKDVGEGTGLGLSMIYGFVRQSGGFVEIESEPNQGCAVRLYLPRAIERADAVTANDTGPMPQRSLNGTVLVVEDDPDVRELVIRLLNELGCTTVEAEDGAMALQRLEENSDIDLMFTDVVLPHGMSGPDIAREARLLRPDLKIVFTSGYPDKEIQNLAWRGERPAIVSKPYSKAKLAEALLEELS